MTAAARRALWAGFLGLAAGAGVWWFLQVWGPALLIIGGSRY